MCVGVTSECKFQDECELGVKNEICLWYVCSVPACVSHTQPFMPGFGQCLLFLHTHTHTRMRELGNETRGNSCAELMPGRCAETMGRVWELRVCISGQFIKWKLVLEWEHCTLSLESVNNCFGVALLARIMIFFFVWCLQDISLWRPQFDCVTAQRFVLAHVGIHGRKCCVLLVGDVFTHSNISREPSLLLHVDTGGSLSVDGMMPCDRVCQLQLQPLQVFF